jgi:hypothetical protein
LGAIYGSNDAGRGREGAEERRGEGDVREETTRAGTEHEGEMEGQNGGCFKYDTRWGAVLRKVFRGKVGLRPSPPDSVRR